MHFSKTYAQLLVTLPPELRNNAFEYRKLKKLINQTVSELDSLGLGPSVLQSVHEHKSTEILERREHTFDLAPGPESVSGGSRECTVVYEIVSNSSVLEPRLRLSSCRHSSDAGRAHLTVHPIYRVDLLVPEHTLSRIMRAPLLPPTALESETLSVDDSNHALDLIVPLPSDTAFLQLLSSTLSSLSDNMDALYNGFNSTLTKLAVSISRTARPISSCAPRSFSAYSPTAGNVVSLRPCLGGKSDLYAWRKIFRLYAEAEVFESVNQSTRGERRIEGMEERLESFERVVQEEKAGLTLPGSREGLDLFLKLNAFILGVEKLELANSEATRKILKKHAKRTTLPIPSYLFARAAPSSSRRAPSVARPLRSLPRLLVQAVGEVLLPVIPHVDDYSCLICTSIAFKPIRLCCGHFFCVRCLVKMQKRGMPNCPLCRTPAVLQANPSNIDYGLLNFMADWFPIESREKQYGNEREVNEERLEELGISDARACRIM